MESLRNTCTGRWPVHSFQKRQMVAAALIGAAILLAPVSAAAQSTFVPAASTIAAAPAQSGQGVADFYKARQGAPLWLAPQSGDAALKLLTLLNTSSIDGLSPTKYDVPELQKLLDRAHAKNKRKDVERADEALVGRLRRLCRRSPPGPRRRNHLGRSGPQTEAADSARCAAPGGRRSVSVGLCGGPWLDAPVLRRTPRCDRPAQI